MLNFTRISDSVIKCVNHILISPYVIPTNGPLSSTEEKIVEHLSNKENFKEAVEIFNSIDKSKAYERFSKSVNAKCKANQIRRYLYYGSATVAATLLILFYVLTLNSKKENEITLINHFAKNPVSQVLLNTADGKQYTTSGEIRVVKSGISVNEKKLVSVDNEADESKNINTVITPKGVRQKVLLSDGTVVWLNTETRLSFPTNFNGDSREVSLEGEAFFDVTKSAKPFIVNIGEKSIRVHGTTFNVSSYNDFKSSTVSLYTGSVEVITPSNSQFLSPGYHVEIDNTSNEISYPIENCNLSPDWIRGRIEFDRQPLSKLLESVSRWYDVDYVLDKDVQDLKVIIYVSDKITLEEIIKLLQLTNNITIIYDGKTITIKGNQKKM